MALNAVNRYNKSPRVAFTNHYFRSFAKIQRHITNFIMSNTTTTITLVPQHSYLLACVAAFYLTNFVLGASIGAARKRHGIKYPDLYATRGMFIGEDGKVDEKKWEEHGVKFNQAQRGHQHITETESSGLALMLTTGLFYPTYAATWGAAWVVGTLAYGFGYAHAPNFRMPGSLLVLTANIAWMYGLYCAGTAVYRGTPI